MADERVHPMVATNECVRALVKAARAALADMEQLARNSYAVSGRPLKPATWREADREGFELALALETALEPFGMVPRGD